MPYNQLLAFLDYLDTTIHKHIVMFYEEPEYAKLVQFRFLSNGLTRGERAMYVVNDKQEMPLIQRGMIEYGIDFDKYSEKGLLQLYVNDGIRNLEEFKQVYGMFFEDMEEKFLNYHQKQNHILPPALPPVRGVGLAIVDAFAEKGRERNGESLRTTANATTQLQIERFFHNEKCPSFDGSWICSYQMDNVNAHMNNQWMADILNSHDAVLFLSKLSNGIALSLKRE
jgi:MEDS: MEthanogen/methylotroph, DcmR Sensory domain